MESKAPLSVIDIMALSSLYRRHYVLHDWEDDVWLFEERLDEQSYGLNGQTLNPEILGKRHTASLCGRFKRNDSSNRVSVMMNDINSTKPDRYLGLWMFVRLVIMIMKLGGENVFDKIIINIDVYNEQRIRSYLYRYLFSRNLLPSGKENISCNVEDLHRVAVIEINEIDFPEIVREWHADKSCATS